MKTYKVDIDNYTFLVNEIESIPEGYEYSEDYKKHYEVHLFGKVVFYLAKGHETEPNWIVLWYAATKNFHRSFGKTFKDTIEMGMEDIFTYIGIQG